VFALVALVVFAAGCGKNSSQASRTPLTERQRDSILATEPIPGASVVGRALNASDRAAARAANMNATTDSLTQ
jgi:hypothetical protein